MWGGGGGVRRRNFAEGFYFAEEFLNFGVLFVSGGGEGSVVGDNLLEKVFFVGDRRGHVFEVSIQLLHNC